MQLLIVLALSGALGLGGLVQPPAATAATPAILGLPPPWLIGVVNKLVVRSFEFAEWIEQDLSAQLDRRRRDDPPPLLSPPLEAVTSGGSSTVVGAVSVPSRRARGRLDRPGAGGMIP